MAAAGRSLPSAEFVPYFLAGLGPDYNGIVTSVTARLEPISPDELLGHLLAHEARLLHHSEINSFLTEASTHYIAKSSSRSRGQENRGDRHSNRGRNGGRFNINRGRDTGNYGANFTSTNYSTDINWYPDAAATHHITSELSNLNLNALEYGGDEQLRVGDGSSIPISHSNLASFLFFLIIFCVFLRLKRI